MSSSGRAEDTYRIGTRSDGPLCRFTGTSCSCGTDCRRCRVPGNSIGAKLLVALTTHRIDELTGIMESEEIGPSQPEANLEELEHELQHEEMI